MIPVACESDESPGSAIERLLVAKRKGAELEPVPQDPTLQTFIERELARQEAGEFAMDAGLSSVEPFNALFVDELERVQR